MPVLVRRQERRPRLPDRHDGAHPSRGRDCGCETSNCSRPRRWRPSEGSPAGVAHDFNNLLTAVLGYSDLILAGDLSEPGGTPRTTSPRSGARRCGPRNSPLRYWPSHGVNRVSPRSCRANDLIRESEPLLRRTLGEDVELDYRLAPDAGSIEVDPGQFAQILLNLAVNARDAMPGGGRLAVDTSRIATRAPSWMRLTIADTGWGMDRETVVPRVRAVLHYQEDPARGRVSVWRPSTE